MEIRKQSPWGTHEFRVKTLDGSTPGAGGARLGFTCRSCHRKFSQTPSNHRTWAVNEQGMALDSAVTDRWLSEECVRHPTEMDDDDRKKVRAPA